MFPLGLRHPVACHPLPNSTSHLGITTEFVFQRHLDTWNGLLLFDNHIAVTRTTSSRIHDIFMRVSLWKKPTEISSFSTKTIRSFKGVTRRATEIQINLTFPKSLGKKHPTRKSPVWDKFKLILKHVCLQDMGGEGRYPDSRDPFFQIGLICTNKLPLPRAHQKEYNDT